MLAYCTHALSLWVKSQNSSQVSMMHLMDCVPYNSRNDVFSRSPFRPQENSSRTSILQINSHHGLRAAPHTIRYTAWQGLIQDYDSQFCHRSREFRGTVKVSWENNRVPKFCKPVAMWVKSLGRRNAYSHRAATITNRRGSHAASRNFTICGINK